VTPSRPALRVGSGGGGGVLYLYKVDLKRHAHTLSGDAGADLQLRSGGALASPLLPFPPSVGAGAEEPLPRY